MLEEKYDKVQEKFPEKQKREDGGHFPEGQGIDAPGAITNDAENWYRKLAKTADS